jgi:hypothetical protein
MDGACALRAPGASQRQQPVQHSRISVRHVWWAALFHADAEPVLQFVQGGEAAFLERRVPQLGDGLPGCRAEDAEKRGRGGHGVLFCLLVHVSLP